MSKYFRSLGVNVAVLTLVLGPAAFTARASFNTSPGSPIKISYKTFLTTGVTPFTPVQSVSFSTGGKHPISGMILSQVFKKGHMYAYLYQIQIANVAANSGRTLNSFTIAPWKSAFASYTKDNRTYAVAQITMLGSGQANTSGFLFPGSTVAFSTAQGTDGVSLIGNFPTSGNALRRGTTSAVLVVLSHKAPVEGSLQGTANAGTTGSVDGGVYVPSPEPSSLVMLALGGAGLVGLPLWRRRRPAQS
jgi:MYXO-CTERM domain-containing protein